MPLYTYKHCDKIWETSRLIKDRDNVHCQLCGQKADKLVDEIRRPIFMEYFDEGLGTQVTGPKQRQRIMKSKGLEETG